MGNKHTGRHADPPVAVKTRIHLAPSVLASVAADSMSASVSVSPWGGS